MSEVIKLVRLDCKENRKDDKTIVEAEVGPGETFLGRGPLLKIDVTSISRKHCLIKFNAETNQLLLTCNHRNSIFVKKSESKTWDELKDGNTVQLFHEDEMRFLKEQFLFQVVAPFLGKNKDNKKENEVSHNTEPEDLVFTSNPQEFKENKPIDENTVVPDPDIAITPKPTGLKCEKKRKLPSWMNQPSGSGISPHKKQKTSPDKPNKYVENARFVNPQLRGEKDKAEKEDAENLVEVNNEENEDQDSISLLVTNCNDKETRQSPAKKIQISPYVSDEDEECNENKENSDSKQLNHSNKKRKSCPFGASCYRKNPIHRQEASHPGDDDYKDVNKEDKNDDDDDDDKPECEFGTDCYRKNPQHRKQFKHTVRPKKKRAAKAAKKKAKNEDAYDSDDSFINDEDDWEPVDDSDDDADFAPAAEDVSSDFEASADLSSELE